MSDEPVSDELSRPSKSQRKRDAHALQALAESLLELSAGELARIPVPEDLLRALEDTRRMRKREALRRQKQYLGKLMRSIDPEPIRAALQVLRNEARAETERFRQTESWRDRILAEGDPAIEAFLERHAGDRQQLRRLARDAAREAEHGKPPRSARQLFRYLREAMAETPRQAPDG